VQARSQGGGWARRATVLVCLAVLAAVAMMAPVRYVFLATELAIAILYATSLNLLMGFGGMLSLGHAAYYALGSYAAALAFVKFGWPMAAAMALGPLVAVFAGLVFGVFIVRISHQEHAYFLMLTLAFSQLVFTVIYRWYSLTGGDDGITGMRPSGWVATPQKYCLFVLAVVSASLYLLWRIVHSPFGLTLQAIRDNPQRAEFVGLSIRRHQLMAFAIAGLFAGIAGALYAFFSGTISPQIADWGASARPFLANTIGGVQSFWGPALGTIVLETIDSQVGRLTEHSLLAVAALAIFVGMFLPRGVIGLLIGDGKRGATLRRWLGPWRKP
jgi:branched-chain amino acid transport system permease protein